MSILAESDIERFVIEMLMDMGYTYVYGPNISPGGVRPERSSFSDVVLVDRLREALEWINPQVPVEAREEAIKQLQQFVASDLISNNEAFHRMLTEGVKVNYIHNGVEKGALVQLVDFKNPQNNDFLVTNQFTIVENNVNKRPDIVIFVNGLPLVVMELKNPVNEKVRLRGAFDQVQTYMQKIQSLFVYNEFIILSDGFVAKAGTISSDYSHFMAWKSMDGKTDASPLIGQIEILVKGMLNKSTLLDIVRFFIVFNKTVSAKTGQLMTVKKLAFYHQYYATNKAVDSILRASSEGGNRKGGVIWHTQGSGKSLTMVFIAGKLIQQMDNPTIVVITDRNDLDDQLYETFSASKQLLRQEPVQAQSREDLKQLLRTTAGGIVFTTMQKFLPDEGDTYPLLSDRRNIVVFVDEAHRTQYGFKPKTIIETDEQGNTTSKTVYGLAKYLRDALPNATYIGFTGTPIEESDRNTPMVFGDYIDIYDIERAQEDGATVKIYYESRLAKIGLSEEGRQLIKQLEADEPEIESLPESEKYKWTKLESLLGNKERLQRIADDIVKHFEERQKAFEGKGMIVTATRRIAADLYEEIVRIKPEWHSDDIQKGAIKVVITSVATDGPELAKHHTTKQERRILAERMKDPQDELKLVIVCDMWLTGFDVPCLHTMYLDKPMKGHTLMQAIARVNRIYKDKPGGLIVDYLGVAADLREALAFYSESGGRGDPIVLQEEAVKALKEKLDVVRSMFDGFDYQRYFTADTSQKLTIILEAEDYILGLNDGKKTFINQVTALSKAFSLAVPHEEALAVKEEVAFFQAVKSRLVKYVRSDTLDDIDALDSVVKQVIDKSIVVEEVKKQSETDISILSDEFLEELKTTQYKNVAVATLEKILGDEIRGRSKINLVQSRTLTEMLESTINSYQNKIMTATQVIEELIKVAKEITESDKTAQDLGLTDYEYAFYTAVATNKSARELMGKDKLRELAIVLYDQIRNNASTDWTFRDASRAKLRALVKRILRKYGYPPDMQLLATETVLDQAELLIDEIIQSKIVEQGG